jgi:hypothetical protein
VSEEKKSVVGKVLAWVGGVVGAVLTAILVAWVTKQFDSPAPTNPPPGTTTPARSKAPIVVGGPVHLLTPKLGDHFYSYAWSDKAEKQVSDDNVDPTLFQHDSKANELQALAPRSGTLITKDPYKNYLLTIEYKWGEKTHGDWDGKARRFYVVVNGQGEDSPVSGIWLSGYRIDLSEGACGNVSVLGTGTKASVHTKARKVPGPKPTNPKGTTPQRDQWLYDPKAELVDGIASSVAHLGCAATWEDVKGAHPSGDHSIPGDWNKLEVYCANGILKVRVNGSKDLNVFEKLTRLDGRIQIVPSGTELSIRRIDLEPPKW